MMNKMETSQNTNSSVKKQKKLKNKHETKSNNGENISNEIEMSQSTNSNIKKTLIDEDSHEVVKKLKNKDETKSNNGESISNEIEILQSKDNNIKKVLIDKDTYEVKSKDKYITNKIETLQNAGNDVKKENEEKKSKNEKSEIEDIKNEIETSQNKDTNETSKNKDGSEIGFVDENIRNEMETSQNEDNDPVWISGDMMKVSKDKSEDEDMSNESENSNVNIASKNEDKNGTESEDEGIEEEYCSDVTYLARKMTSAEKLNQSDSIKLYNLHVQLRHKVLPQHKIETRAGSHMPTQKEIEKFQKIIAIKKGSYSANEDKIIVNNWNAFCKLHNWDVKRIQPFLHLRIGKLTYMCNITERRKFVQFLADGLPNRTLYSVYHRFRNLYEDNVHRRYKPEEDEMIIDHLENNPSLDEKRKYVDLAKVLRRTRNSIWRRYRILKREREKDT